MRFGGYHIKCGTHLLFPPDWESEDFIGGINGLANHYFFVLDHVLPFFGFFDELG